MNRRNCAALLATSLLAGCSGMKAYPDALPKNLHIRTETSSGSMLSKVRAAVHIHRVDAGCRTEYQGTLELNEAPAEAGLPADRWSLLVFVFATSSFLSGSSGSIHYETLLKPRTGYTYDVKVSYVDRMYGMAVREIGPGGSASREIERRSWKTCIPE